MSNHQQIATALGLDATASADEVRATGERLDAFLATAPAELSGWAARQRRLAQQAVAGAPLDATTVAAAEDLDAAGIDEDQLPERVAAAKGATGLPAKKPSKAIRPLAIAAATAAIVMGVFYMSPKDDQPAAPQAQAQASETPVVVNTPKPVDPQMVKVLQDKVKANPKDTASMKALGQVYSDAQQYKTSASWMRRVTTTDPTDTDGWMGLGAAQFYDKDLAGAEKSWQQAVKLNPKNSDAHYNLGFLYLSLGDQPRAKASWQKVVELAPDSTEAKTVQSHLAAWNAASAPSGTPVPSATPSR